MSMDKPIRYLKGVGEKRAELFEKKGINTVSDLLYFFPRSYEDRSERKLIDDCTDGESVCIAAVLESEPRDVYIRRGMMITSAVAYDESGMIQLVWYNNKYVKNNFKLGERYVFFGKISHSRQGQLQMTTPIYERYGENKYTGSILPVYSLTAKLSQKTVQSTIRTALDDAGEIEEYLPDEIRRDYKIAEINFSMRNIHFPKSLEDSHIARERFVFEELLTLQLVLSGKRKENSDTAGIVFEDVKCIREFAASLPYELTGAQKRTINEICKDVRSGRRMNRLVQGDVGSGKTAVAAAAIYMTVKNGGQAAMMAPTEILAAQHYESLREMFEGFGIRVVLFKGGMKAKERRAALEEIALGTADVVVGTHALISEGTEYKNLAFVVADEQHRFGVEQRAKLSAKGNNPHMLIMSATPIPRTLALILYGDLDVSIIDELPPGRKPVKTYAVEGTMRRRVYNFVEKNILGGMQAYVVCPLVSETEKSDLKNAEELAEKLRQSFPNICIGLMHGKMSGKDKDVVMEKFVSGEINLLVATTVIEVGVNVPNANIMVIENAERFGLSQLHQLRGRVGRGSDAAYCILISDAENDITKKRLEIMCVSNDGFYISEQDLKLRGPGDFFGTRQHGLPEMKIANLFEDRDILVSAQKAAKEILQKGLETYPKLKERCDKMLSDEIIMN